MTTLSIQPPFPILTDADGQPLGGVAEAGRQVACHLPRPHPQAPAAAVHVAGHLAEGRRMFLGNEHRHRTAVGGTSGTLPPMAAANSPCQEGDAGSRAVCRASIASRLPSSG